MKSKLSLLGLVSVIFFNVCGGPYALEPVLNAGPGLALLLIVLTPLLWAMPIAVVCAELGTALPEEGGYYAWSKRALGPFWAFCHGWWAWLFTLVDLGFYPTMFCDYLAYFFPVFGVDGDFWLRKGMMVAMIWTLVALNLRSVRTVGRFTTLFAALVISPFALMVLWGSYRALTEGFPLSPVQPFVPPQATLATALAAALPIVLWNFQGWDAISTVAGEMNDPRKDYPRALGWAALLITAVYGLPALMALGFVGATDVEWTTGSWSVAGERVAGPWLGAWMSAMGMVSAAGLYASLVLVYSRVPFVVAENGYLPQSLTRCNAAGAPVNSLIVCGLLHTVVVLTFRDFEELAEVDVTLFAVVMGMELCSFLALRRNEPLLPRPFRVPGGWLIAGLVCVVPVACVTASIILRSRESGWWPVVGKAGVLLATGPLLYPLLDWWRRKKRSPRNT